MTIFERGMRLNFGIPREPSNTDLKRLSLLNFGRQEACEELSNYLLRVFRPLISRDIEISHQDISEAVAEAIDWFVVIAAKYKKFRLADNPEKFVRCCYRKVWRELLLRWKEGVVKIARDEKRQRQDARQQGTDES